MKKPLILSIILPLAACGPSEKEANTAEAPTPKNTENGTCVACGMVMREQPAPRGQVVHRDGTRAYLCSIDDLVQYLDIPSPNGKPVKIYAEIMPDAHGRLDMDVAWRPWGEVTDVFFVIGIERGAVMGDPVMTYRTEQAAGQAAREFGGTIVTFERLREANRERDTE